MRTEERGIAWKEHLDIWYVKEVYKLRRRRITGRPHKGWKSKLEDDDYDYINSHVI